MDIPGNRRVLIADDDPGIRLLLATYLRGQGFALLEARNGSEALAEMRAGNADLVIMDLMMPELSGWDVLRERAADPALQRIPMIVVTANSGSEVETRAHASGVFAVLGKPFDLHTLLTAVTTCLEHPNVTAETAALQAHRASPAVLETTVL